MKQACNGGELAACVTLGAVYDPYGGLIPDYDDIVMARSLYKKACDGGVMSWMHESRHTYNYGNDRITTRRAACSKGLVMEETCGVATTSLVPTNQGVENPKTAPGLSHFIRKRAKGGLTGPAIT